MDIDFTVANKIVDKYVSRECFTKEVYYSDNPDDVEIDWGKIQDSNYELDKLD